jgi:hypothetical protein
VPRQAGYVQEPPHLYPPVGRCIYCGDPPIGDEHIVPSGLGGRWILPDASCKKCEGITSAIEGANLRGPLNGMRSYLKLAKRRPKEKAKGVRGGGQVRGRDASFILPAEHAPAVLGLPTLSIPGVFGDKAGTTGIWTTGTNLRWPILRGYGISQISIDMNLCRFTQLLAKIGHAFAVAEVGIDNFEPLLLEMIRKEPEPEDATHFVGSELGFEPPSLSLHAMQIIDIVDRGIPYVGVRIRLFANLASPTYLVIAGIRKSQLARQ